MFFLTLQTQRDGTSLSLLYRFLFYARLSSGKCTLLLSNGMIKYRDFILQDKYVATVYLSDIMTKMAICRYKNAINSSNRLLTFHRWRGIFKGTINILIVNSGR